MEVLELVLVLKSRQCTFTSFYESIITLVYKMRLLAMAVPALEWDGRPST